MTGTAIETGYASHFTYTASDTVDEPNGICDAVFVQAAGNATVLLESSAATLTLTGLTANTILRLRIRRVNASSLTATLIGLRAM